MARENRVTAVVAAYVTLGAVFGAIVGFATHLLLDSYSQARFEGSVGLFRIPSSGTEQAARDYIAAAIEKDGFLDSFIDKQKLEAKDKRLLTRNLRVVARDASSPNAQLKIVSDNPVGLETTLDALAIHLTESVRNIEDSALQSLLHSLNDEISTANSDYLALVGKRSAFSALDTSLQNTVNNIADIVSNRTKIDLARRYSFSLSNSSNELIAETQIKRLAEQEQRETALALSTPNVNAAQFEFANSLAVAEAKLRALRQTKQRLVIEFNQGTPLRVTGGAQIGLLDPEPPNALLIIGMCALVGGLLGGIWWSLIQSKHSKFDGPTLEKRLNTSVLGVIPKTVSEFAESNLVPMAVSAPDRIAVSAIRSLNVALHFLLTEQQKIVPIIFSTLHKNHHAAHIVANLAIVMAHNKQPVLVLEGGENTVSSAFGDMKTLDHSSSITIQTIENESDIKRHQETGSVDLCRIDSPVAQSTFLKGDFQHYQQVLVLPQNIHHARRMFSNLDNALQLLVCSDKDRISKIRKVLKNSFKGVIICGYALEESEYGGAAIKNKKGYR